MLSARIYVGALSFAELLHALPLNPLFEFNDRDFFLERAPKVRVLDFYVLQKSAEHDEEDIYRAMEEKNLFFADEIQYLYYHLEHPSIVNAWKHLYCARAKPGQKIDLLSKPNGLERKLCKVDTGLWQYVAANIVACTQDLSKTLPPMPVQRF